MSDSLHGVTLKVGLEQLVEAVGWEELAERVPIRCFSHDPSLASSLKFLRRTPWARAKVETLIARDQAKREKKRKRNLRRKARRAFASSIPVERDDTLALIWPEGGKLPSVELEEGYRLEHGVGPRWFSAVQQSIGFQVTEEIWSSMQLVDGAMVFACHGEQPVAVGCAEHREGGWVEIGWVAVAPAHRGHGLGKAVCAELVKHLLAAGHDRLWGSTQDERTQALDIYLSLGFQPVERKGKEERWAAALAKHEGQA